MNFILLRAVSTVTDFLMTHSSIERIVLGMNPSPQIEAPNPKSKKTKIFVDGNCIVCDWEISHYKRMAPDLFELVDISAPEFNAAEHGLTAEAVNAQMHLVTPDGELRIGVDAFAHIWSRLPRYRFAKVLVELPILSSFAKLGYRIFAASRPYLPKKKR